MWDETTEALSFGDAGFINIDHKRYIQRYVQKAGANGSKYNRVGDEQCSKACWSPPQMYVIYHVHVCQ
jgi:hypothetical protein